MKKNNIFLTLTSIPLVFLSSCVDPNKPIYNLDVEMDMQKELVLTNAISGKHNEGEKFTCKIATVTDVGNYVFLNDEKLTEEKSENGFEYFEFNMPGKDSVLVFTHNPFYADTEYLLKDVFYFANNIKIDNLKSISITKGYIGVAPDIPPYYKMTSENPTDFQSFVSWLSSAKLRKSNNGLVGGSYIEIDFTLTSQEVISFRFANGEITYFDFSSSTTFALVTQMPEFIV